MTFHRSSLRLAGLYLAIIMAISLFFSASIYNVSLHELDRGLRGPARVSIVEELPGYGKFMRDRLQDQRDEQFETARNHVLQSLIIVNLCILVGAGFLSYYLAYRTLKPIEEAHEAQSRFTSDASHELRTPIAAMQTETEVSLMDPTLTLAGAKAQLSSNLEELGKITSLTEGLLGLAQNDDMQLDANPISVQSVLDTALAQKHSEAKKKHIKIIAPKDCTQQVQANEALLTEAMVIILDNALKYSNEKSEVTIVVKSSQKQVKIEVKDQGQGIRASDLPHIYDRFYRADSARNKKQVDGYGLGLSLAQRIITLHGGTIQAVSKIDKGSTFTLTIPEA